MKAAIAAKTLSDEIMVDNIEVKAGNENSGKRADPQGEGQLIAFSKEQQWRIDFRAEKPARRPVSAPFPVTGELIPVSNSEVTISAPLAGILSVSKRLPYVGQKVEADELLAQIDPAIHQPGGIGQLTAAYSEAKNRAALAQKEYDRAKRLYAGKAAPQRRVEEAELALDTANAALDPLEKAMQGMKPGTSENRILVRAPFRATVVELMASNGKAVEAGQPLMRLVDTTTLWLRANIPVTEIAKLRRFDDVTFAVAGAGNGHRPSRLVAVNDVVDPRSRTVPVIFEVANPKGRLKAGMFADLSIATGRAEHGLTVPDGALFEDEGRFFVFVQREGELFVRREVSVGTQGNGYAQINGGIREDERVVTKGGYYVKLASLSARTQQGHGHDH
jgi:RND family efflux transporter MFP subunit